MSYLIFVRLFRSRRPEVFCKKSALTYFRKINSKTPVPESVLIKLQKTPAQVPSCEFCESLKNTYFVKHLRTAAVESLDSNMNAKSCKISRIDKRKIQTIKK